MASLVEHAAHWDALAEEADRIGDCEKSRGRYDGVQRNKAETYRRTAEALRIEDRTGVSVCVCCHKPLGRGIRL